MSEFHTDAGAPGSQHSDITPELRQLAYSILDRLDPAVRGLAARAQAGGAGKCEQVWCPVCALAALIAGEEHPLLNVVAEHSVALLALVEAMLHNFDDKPPQADDPPADSASDTRANVAPEPGRYENITVTVQESGESESGESESDESDSAEPTD